MRAEGKATSATVLEGMCTLTIWKEGKGGRGEEGKRGRGGGGGRGLGGAAQENRAYKYAQCP
jgi:hypothetical protein